MIAARVAIVVFLAPWLVAATDRAGDIERCPGLAGGAIIGTATADGMAAETPDLVSAFGEIVELGTSVRFTLRFAEPLVVPDDEGRPLRVDIVLRDPDVPVVDAGLYRGVNRLLRYDAVADPVTTILLLPEAGQSRFLPPAIDGDTLTLQVPGRTVSADEDETGTSPGLGRLRWGVIVRDERACDLLGNGRATERLVEGETAAASLGDVHGAQTEGRVLMTGIAICGVLIAYLLVRRRARSPR